VLRQITPLAAAPQTVGEGLSYLVLLRLPLVLPLNALHLILETELQLLQPDFF
jgi:hypothetical protein